MNLDALALARRQLDADEAATHAVAGLRDHKVARMAVSPLAFLRGSAGLFYTLLKEHPALAAGPDGTGLIVGDLHVENFGAFRADAVEDDDAETVFDINDFDDANVAPLRWDVLRLATSLLLGGRALGADGPSSLATCDALLSSYARHLAHDAEPSPAPPTVQALVARSATRTRARFLDGRTEVLHGQRRFVRGDRYRDLDARLARAVPRCFADYVGSLDAALRPAESHLEIVDAAFRIAGTGSLGRTRVAVLVRGKGGRDGHWIFDLKEQGDPSSAVLVPPSVANGAQRVLEAMRWCLARPPRMAGTSTLLGATMLGRRLAPQEDKLELASVPRAELADLAAYLGSLTARAHLRGTVHAPPRWKPADVAMLRANAVVLAGIHEAADLAYCHLATR